MEIRTILAPSTGEVSENIALAVSADLARRFGAHVQGLHIRKHRSDQIHMPEPMWQEVVHSEGEADQAATGTGTVAREAFRKACEQVGLVPTRGAAQASPAPTASWGEMVGATPKVLAVFGKLADLIVILHPRDSIDRRTGRFIHSVLSQTGSPLLLVPEHWQGSSVGRHVVIAWDRGVAAMAAVKSCLGLLRAAESVTVLAIKSADKVGPDARDLVRYLSRQDVNAESVLLEPNRGEPDEVLLHEARERSADLIVMGAYTHPRLLQMLFGGVTRSMLQQSEIPVLLRT